MGLFGCLFVRTLLALIHRQIYIRIISWMFKGPFEPFLVTFPTSGYVQALGNTEGKIRVRLHLLKPIRFCVALMFNSKMGLAESYMEGAWTAEPSPKEFLCLLMRAKRRRKDSFGLLPSFRRKLSTFWRKLQLKISPSPRANTHSRSRQNVKAHYDLGNELFRHFLDSSMTYSCALFQDLETAEMASDSEQSTLLLYDAQMRKYDAILDALGGVGNGQHILEIGCGWGAFGIRAVHRHGCRWTGLTLSTVEWALRANDEGVHELKEQLRLARDRVQAEGLNDKLELKLLDYRDESGQFDHVVAVEMIEAVGHDFLPCFFRVCSQRLKPGGKLCIQAILCPDAHYEQYKHSTDFIRKHIFPGGHLPSLAAIRAALPGDLSILDVQMMDKHYALTLDYWRNSWIKNRTQIQHIIPSDQFFLKWDMYFSLCSALFEYNSVHVAQILLQKGPE